MTDLSPLLGTALTSFAATNLDSLAVLAPTLWATAGARQRLRTAIGSVLGSALVLACAALAACGLSSLPPTWIRWVGLLPLLLGLHHLFRRGRSTAQVPEAPSCTGLFGGAALTVAMGADNVAVLGPLLRVLGAEGGTTLAAVHTLLFTTCLSAVALTPGLLHRGHHMIQPAAACLTIAVGARILAG
jgi:cadmium resistance protein CadD (predicted permease)